MTHKRWRNYTTSALVLALAGTSIVGLSSDRIGASSEDKAVLEAASIDSPVHILATDYRIPLGGSHDPSEHVSGYEFANGSWNEITDDVTVVDDTVDPTTPGEYSVTYQYDSDEYGLTEETVTIYVSSSVSTQLSQFENHLSSVEMVLQDHDAMTEDFQSLIDDLSATTADVRDRVEQLSPDGEDVQTEIVGLYGALDELYTSTLILEHDLAQLDNAEDIHTALAQAELDRLNKQLESYQSSKDDFTEQFNQDISEAEDAENTEKIEELTEQKEQSSTRFTALEDQVNQQIDAVESELDEGVSSEPTTDVLEREKESVQSERDGRQEVYSTATDWLNQAIDESSGDVQQSLEDLLTLVENTQEEQVSQWEMLVEELDRQQEEYGEDSFYTSRFDSVVPELSTVYNAVTLAEDVWLDQSLSDGALTSADYTLSEEAEETDETSESESTSETEGETNDGGNENTEESNSSEDQSENGNSGSAEESSESDESTGESTDGETTESSEEETEEQDAQNDSENSDSSTGEEESSEESTEEKPEDNSSQDDENSGENADDNSSSEGDEEVETGYDPEPTDDADEATQDDESGSGMSDEVIVGGEDLTGTVVPDWATESDEAYLEYLQQQEEEMRESGDSPSDTMPDLGDAADNVDDRNDEGSSGENTPDEPANSGSTEEANNESSQDESDESVDTHEEDEASGNSGSEVNESSNSDGGESSEEESGSEDSSITIIDPETGEDAEESSNNDDRVYETPVTSNPDPSADTEAGSGMSDEVLVGGEDMTGTVVPDWATESDEAYLEYLQQQEEQGNGASTAVEPSTHPVEPSDGSVSSSTPGDTPVESNTGAGRNTDSSDVANPEKPISSSARSEGNGNDSTEGESDGSSNQDLNNGSPETTSAEGTDKEASQNGEHPSSDNHYDEIPKTGMAFGSIGVAGVGFATALGTWLFKRWKNRS